jgi:hypothetical protein
MEIWTRTKTRKGPERPHSLSHRAPRGLSPAPENPYGPRCTSEPNTWHGDLHDSRKYERRENVNALRSPNKTGEWSYLLQEESIRGGRYGAEQVKTVTITRFTFLNAHFFTRQLR